jgi:glycerol uptake facilitator-like aquaporin
LARGFTTTFTGIAINHVPGFVVAQLVGATCATAISLVVFSNSRTHSAEAVAPGE